MHLLSIVGARPQFIKAAVVCRAFAERPDHRHELLHTGQHYDAGMSGVFFEEMRIPEPDHRLAIGSAPHGAQTGRMLEAIESVLLSDPPDAVIVYGDTNSTLAGALAAVKQHIPVAHVEAGLRSFNRAMPEEINRVLTDHSSDLLLAPTETAVANLAAEGIEAGVWRVGDVMCDAVQHYLDIAAARSDILSRLDLTPDAFVLATVHRAENTDDPGRLGAIFDGLKRFDREAAPVVLPLHPRTAKAADAPGIDADGLTHVIEPVGYLDMLTLERAARLVATDSGGVQKEAFFCRTPCVTLRGETEWVELVDRGWNRLAPPAEAGSVFEALSRAWEAGPPEQWPPIFGAGDAGQQIVQLVGRMPR